MSNQDNKSPTFTKEEQEAMRARAKELKAEAKALKNRAIGEGNLMKAISELSDSDKTLASEIHKLITNTAPELWPKTWYGMPAYATKEGKVICFFQASSKFQTRYSTFGFQPDANIDDGNMWPTSFAIIKLTELEKMKIIELVKKALS